MQESILLLFCRKQGIITSSFQCLHWSAKTSLTRWEVQPLCFLLICTQTPAHWHPKLPIKWYGSICSISLVWKVQFHFFRKNYWKFHSNGKCSRLFRQISCSLLSAWISGKSCRQSSTKDLLHSPSFWLFINEGTDGVLKFKINQSEGVAAPAIYQKRALSLFLLLFFSLAHPLFSPITYFQEPGPPLLSLSARSPYFFCSSPNTKSLEQAMFIITLWWIILSRGGGEPAYVFF